MHKHSDAKSAFFGLLDLQNGSVDENNKNISSTSSGSSSYEMSETKTLPLSDGKTSEKDIRFEGAESTLSPSQIVLIQTTVPQNIRGQNIVGRHKPTKGSLRHSRMIMASKNYQEHAESTNFLNINSPRLARVILISKILIGLLLLVVSGWISLFAISTPIQQNPFWSGFIILLSGLFGIYLLSFGSSRSLHKSCLIFMKVKATLIIISTIFLCTLAFIYAAFHFSSLTSDNKLCFPENMFAESSSCICVFGLSQKYNSSEEIDFSAERNIVHFKDLSCSDLPHWIQVLLSSMVLNFLGLVLSVCFLTQFIFGCRKRKKIYFAGNKPLLN